ncbi:MAG: hypothetical protein AAFW69_00630 [Pseudomonadota bacterium]
MSTADDPAAIARLAALAAQSFRVAEAALHRTAIARREAEATLAAHVAARRPTAPDPGADPADETAYARWLDWHEGTRRRLAAEAAEAAAAWEAARQTALAALRRRRAVDHLARRAARAARAAALRLEERQIASLPRPGPLSPRPAPDITAG